MDLRWRRLEMKNFYLSWEQIESGILEIVHQLQVDSWKPDIIVGIFRGGSTPAIMLGNYLNVKTYSLDVRLRDNKGSVESNNTLAQLAFINKMNVLIIDDINDCGDTINWVIEDWRNICQVVDIEKVWGKNLRSAVLVENAGSSILTHYNAIDIDKREEDVWVVFPWERFWRRNLKELKCPKTCKKI